MSDPLTSEFWTCHIYFRSGTGYGSIARTRKRTFASSSHNTLPMQKTCRNSIRRGSTSMLTRIHTRCLSVLRAWYVNLCPKPLTEAQYSLISEVQKTLEPYNFSILHTQFHSGNYTQYSRYCLHNMCYFLLPSCYFLKWISTFEIYVIFWWIVQYSAFQFGMFQG